MALLTPTGLRARAVTVLAPLGPNDPTVIQAPVDAVEPPAVIVAWDDPWLVAETSCLWFANLALICVAHRVEPDTALDQLERMASFAITRLEADGGQAWPLAGSQAPRLLEIAGVPLLGVRLSFRAPVAIVAPTLVRERSAA